jgi:hypothetical protein
MSNSPFDASVGSIFIEIPIMRSKVSGENTHSDLNNQGLCLAFEFGKHSRDLEFEGVALSEMKYWGTSLPGKGELFRRINFSAHY